MARGRGSSKGTAPRGKSTVRGKGKVRPKEEQVIKVADPGHPGPGTRPARRAASPRAASAGPREGAPGGAGQAVKAKPYGSLREP